MNGKRWLLASVFLSLIHHASALEPKDLYGTWKLVSAASTIVATGEKSDLYGSTAEGYLSYGADGRFSVTIVWGPRPKPTDLSKVSDDDRIKLYQTFLAYAGTYSLDGSTATHHVAVSWNETWTGGDQIRFLKVEGETLFIKTMTQPRYSDGKMAYTELVWKKAKPAVETPKK